MTEMQYLGAALSADGFCDNELARRIGMAKADFRSLCKIWRHSMLPWQRKLAIVMLIESKLTYGLATVCLTIAQQRRLNGFQNRCLRSVLGIKSAFVSRISNAQVLARSGHAALTDTLNKKQLGLFGKVLRAAHDSPLHLSSFIPGTTTAATERYVRRVGRPRREWITDLTRCAGTLFGSMQAAKQIAQQPKSWKAAVSAKFQRTL